MDDKGRVIIPLKFRNELGNSFVITRGVGPCLSVYREDDFRQLEEHLLQQPSLDQHVLRMKRLLFAAALDTSVDNQGRVALPNNLREWATIGDDVVIAGMGEKIEIWSRGGWDALNASLTDLAINEAAMHTGLAKTLAAATALALPTEDAG